jgi:hypothetical protein
MRTSWVAFVVAAGLAAPVSAQVLRVRLNDTAATSPIYVALKPSKGPYTTGGLVVPAQRVKQGAAAPTVPDFHIRAWTEGDGLRVLVFAVPVNRQERRIASMHVGWNQPPVQVTAIAKYRARPFTLTADSTPIPVRYSPDVVRYRERLIGPPGVYLGDTPIPPAWQPPPQGSSIHPVR